jgi:alpha-methylacyl-CoA racemase
VLSFAEACEHPQIKARNMVIDVPTPNGKSQKQIASPVVFSATPSEYRISGGQLGADTQEVLLAHGFSQEQIKEWCQRGIVMI